MMETDQVGLVGLFLFATAVASAHFSSSRVQDESRPFASALVELKEPIGVGSKAYVEQLLQNDLVLEQAVKSVSEILYVNVVEDPASPAEDQGRGLDYISSVYQRLWDEMILHDNLQLKCAVIGDRVGNDVLVPNADQCRERGIQAVFSTFLAASERYESMQSLAFPKVKTLPDCSSGGAAGVHYFDACHSSIPRYTKVALGGTFDRMHNGHRKLLTLAAAVCSGPLTVGITGDTMLSAKKGACKITPYNTRRNGVVQFLQSIKPGQPLDVCELSDPFGPTITDPTIEAIVVSSETLSGACKINELRSRCAMRPLDVLVSRRSESSTLSSTFLRDRVKR
eukprot:GSChrysophyteH1.ASY1.ANO1.862.1 assembled CDS